jgi:hypothetical protein
MMQNTDNVRSTKDLGSLYTLVAAFHYDSGRSNTTHKLYSSAGNHLSLSDYNNNQKIDQCLSQNCLYVFSLLLT